MIVNTINKSGNNGGGSNSGYIYDFQEQNWEISGEFYVLRIPPSLHPLGMNCYVASVEKEQNGSYDSTMFSYYRLPNGTIVIQSKQLFNGRAILRED